MKKDKNPKPDYKLYKKDDYAQKPSKKNKSKAVFVLMLSFIFLIFGTMGALNFYHFGKVELKNNLQAEINTKVKASDFVKHIGDNGKIVDNPRIPTNQLGEYPTKIVVQFPQKARRKVMDFTVTIVDTIPPKVIAPPIIFLHKGEKLHIDKYVKATDNSKKAVTLKIDGDYDINKYGEYPIKIIATDESGNQTIRDIKICVTSKKHPKVPLTKMKDIVIVNKSIPLPKKYGDGITSAVKKAYKKMSEAAKKDGINLSIVSGFRSYKAQKETYDEDLKAKGKKYADKHAARPSFSEHQTGLALDINALGANEKWLDDNAYKYGFVLRFPKNKSKITGFMFEPWHYRYVGKKLAKKLYNKGKWITLEEYFEIPSVYYN